MQAGVRCRKWTQHTYRQREREREREDKHQFQYIFILLILHYMFEVGTSRLSRGTCLVAKLKQQRVHALIQRVLLVVRGC